MTANIDELEVSRNQAAKAAGVRGTLLWVHGDPWFRPDGKQFAIRVKRKWLDTVCRHCGGEGTLDNDTRLCGECDGFGWHFATKPIK